MESPKIDKPNLTDLIEESTKASNISELQRKGIRNVRVLDKRKLSEVINKALDQVLKERNLSEEKIDMAKVKELIHSALQAKGEEYEVEQNAILSKMSEEFGQLREMLGRGIPIGGLSKKDQIMLIESSRVLVPDLLKEGKISSNLNEADVDKVESDQSISGNVDKLKNL